MPRKPNTVLIYRKVPVHLRALRAKAGLTQRDLSAKLRKPQSWVARCETAARRIDIAEWVEWCVGCGVDPKAALDDLVERRR
jgi:ribosome-binding protein aMBF1 (putative translation factor)